ncbi:hypothetical protein BLNAU_6334 [Blattamonas nauphoetae]|uniref:Uncharacterized protein n=1 Tax=Blattamonas nauphoetae TaxID=2049346 RepID=A0ABQ9Y4D8_9EUKA|nr:hypothetical protein BLNAU_6334 [Blattamonas nauphoetae]
MGKSASRFPFITLLMSFGVASVSTIKKGEQTYVFKLKNTVETGEATISMDDPNGRFADFVTASYLYTYGVYSLKEGATKPDAQNIPEDASSSTEWEHLGDVSVPSVEHFPYFVRLLVNHDTAEIGETGILLKDIYIFQQSNLNRGSKLAPGSALMLHLICNKKELTEDLNVNEQMILLSGSTVAKDSKIVEYPANTLSLFRDDDGTEIRMSTQPQRTHYGQQETINRDYVLEAGSTLRKGSKVSLKYPHPKTKCVLSKERPITTHLGIAPGSVIKKDSILGAGSSIATLKVENLLKGQHWHVVDDIMFSEQTPMYRDQNYVLFTSPKGSRWEEVNNNQKGMEPTLSSIQSRNIRLKSKQRFSTLWEHKRRFSTRRKNNQRLKTRRKNNQRFKTRRKNNQRFKTRRKNNQRFKTRRKNKIFSTGRKT